MVPNSYVKITHGSPFMIQREARIRLTIQDSKVKV